MFLATTGSLHEYTETLAHLEMLQRMTPDSRRLVSKCMPQRTLNQFTILSQTGSFLTVKFNSTYISTIRPPARFRFNMGWKPCLPRYARHFKSFASQITGQHRDAAPVVNQVYEILQEFFPSQVISWNSKFGTRLPLPLQSLNDPRERIEF